MFWIRGEGSVYFNIRGEESVIQASLRGGECNLLLNFIYYSTFHSNFSWSLLLFVRGVDLYLSFSIISLTYYIYHLLNHFLFFFLSDRIIFQSQNLNQATMWAYGPYRMSFVVTRLVTTRFRHTHKREKVEKEKKKEIIYIFKIIKWHTILCMRIQIIFLWVILTLSHSNLMTKLRS